MAQINFKKSPDGSLLGRVKAFRNFTIAVTPKGYWLPTQAELEGHLRPESDYFDVKGEILDRANRYLYNRVLALVRYLTEDQSQKIDAGVINAEKIMTKAGTAMYRAWFGKEKEEACYFYLSQFPKKKMYRYRTSTAEINSSNPMTRKEWVELREMILTAKQEYKVIPVTDKDEKAAAMNAFFYSLALKKVKEESAADYKKSAEWRKNEQKPDQKTLALKKEATKTKATTTKDTSNKDKNHKK